MLPDLPQRLVAKVCQAGYPLGSRRRPQPSLQRPPASQTISRCSSCHPTRQSSTRRKLSGVKSAKKSSRITPKSIDAVRTKLKQAILYIERNPKSSNPSPHSPTSEVILMWKWYAPRAPSTNPQTEPFAARPGSYQSVSRETIWYDWRLKSRTTKDSGCALLL